MDACLCEALGRQTRGSFDFCGPADEQHSWTCDCTPRRPSTVPANASSRSWTLLAQAILKDSNLLTDTAPTELTVATHSPLGAQPQSDRILRLPCVRLAPAAPYMFVLDALKRACRSSSLQASSKAAAQLATA
eukprot:scaffold93117_cov43-Phaeocystis_antarctica.AAC.3